MSGTIIAEYEDYSLWESKVSNTTSFTLPSPGGTYHISYSYLVPVSTYEDALLEPEWEIFV